MPLEDAINMIAQLFEKDLDKGNNFGNQQSNQPSWSMDSGRRQGEIYLGLNLDLRKISVTLRILIIVYTRLLIFGKFPTLHDLIRTLHDY